MNYSKTLSNTTYNVRVSIQFKKKIKKNYMYVQRVQEKCMYLLFQDTLYKIIVYYKKYV